MTTTAIIPTVGRIVYVRIAGINDRHETQQPFAAMITYVHPELSDEGDQVINVAGYNDHGGSLVMNKIDLLPSTEQLPPFGTYAHWMPYQIKVAEPIPAASPTAAIAPPQQLVKTL